MAMNLIECDEISAAARRAGVALQLGFMRRFDRDFIGAAELLRSGEVGAPMIIKSLTHGPGLPPMGKRHPNLERHDRRGQQP